MKLPLPFLLLAVCLALPAMAADKPAVADCFKVHSLTRTDEGHYWADWSNSCPYTIDSVYVMIGFSDGAHKHVGNSVWGLHFITRGAHRVTRFTTPASVADFQYVAVRKVTTDAEEALR